MPRIGVEHLEVHPLPARRDPDGFEQTERVNGILVIFLREFLNECLDVLSTRIDIERRGEVGGLHDYPTSACRGAWDDGHGEQTRSTTRIQSGRVIHHISSSASSRCSANSLSLSSKQPVFSVSLTSLLHQGTRATSNVLTANAGTAMTHVGKSSLTNPRCTSQG